MNQNQKISDSAIVILVSGGNSFIEFRPLEAASVPGIIISLGMKILDEESPRHSIVVDRGCTIRSTIRKRIGSSCLTIFPLNKNDKIYRFCKMDIYKIHDGIKLILLLFALIYIDKKKLAYVIIQFIILFDFSQNFEYLIF